MQDCEVWNYEMEIVDFLGVNTCNKAGWQTAVFADGTSHFITQIKKNPENLNIKVIIICCMFVI